MLDSLLAVAPALTWLRLSGAAILLLGAFVVLSHALLRHRGYGEEWGGLTGRGGVETALRAGVAMLAAGLLLWGWELGWPGAVLALLGGVALFAGALDVTARARRRSATAA